MPSPSIYPLSLQRRSSDLQGARDTVGAVEMPEDVFREPFAAADEPLGRGATGHGHSHGLAGGETGLRCGREGRDKGQQDRKGLDRKSTRLNSSHLVISYAVSLHLPPFPTTTLFRSSGRP